jgi:hypothetical protein
MLLYNHCSAVEATRYSTREGDCKQIMDTACGRATHSIMGVTEDLNFLFSKKEKVRITVVFSVHWKNLREIITDPDGYNSGHFHKPRYGATTASQILLFCIDPSSYYCTPRRCPIKRCQSTVSQILVLTNPQQRTEYCQKEIVGLE